MKPAKTELPKLIELLRQRNRSAWSEIIKFPHDPKTGEEILDALESLFEYYEKRKNLKGLVFAVDDMVYVVHSYSVDKNKVEKYIAKLEEIHKSLFNLKCISFISGAQEQISFLGDKIIDWSSSLK